MDSPLVFPRGLLEIIQIFIFCTFKKFETNVEKKDYNCLASKTVHPPYTKLLSQLQLEFLAFFDVKSYPNGVQSIT